METQRFIDWLFSEAGAGWVFGVVSLIGLLISILRRKTAQKIIFREISRQSLVIISPNVREKINVSFDGQPVKRLSQLEVEVLNNGLEPVDNVLVAIQLPEVSKVFDISVDGQFGDQSADTKIEEGDVKILLPYLNPFKLHSHRAKISLVLDGKLEGLQVRGSGKGWSLQHEILGKKLVRSFVIYFFLFILYFIIWNIFYYYVVEDILGIRKDEWSLRAFVSLLPFILAFVWLIIRGFKLTRSLTSLVRPIR